jgi:hypothetical protein
VNLGTFPCYLLSSRGNCQRLSVTVTDFLTPSFFYHTKDYIITESVCQVLFLFLFLYCIFFLENLWKIWLCCSGKNSFGKLGIAVNAPPDIDQDGKPKPASLYSGIVSP